MADYAIDGDVFAATVEEILKKDVKSVEQHIPAAVRDACKVGVKEVKGNAPKHTGKYAAGFTYKAMNKSMEAYGEIGNKDYPGLVHLLEKGHATIGGNRVPGHEHVAPAAQVAFTEFEKRINEEIDAAL